MDKDVAYCQLIAKILSVDNEFHELEERWLERTMDRLKLSPEQRKIARDTSDTSEAEQTIHKLPLKERRELKDELVAAALVDGTISAAESRHLAEITDALDLDSRRSKKGSRGKDK